MEMIMGIWILLGMTIALALLAGIFFRLGDIRDACEYFARKSFLQDVETGKKEFKDV